MAKANTIAWDKKAGAEENAKAQLPELARAYFAEVRAVLAGTPKPEDLHELRLASKHFRYTLELFRPCYAKGLEDRIEKLKELQDLLGDCNDAVTTAAVTARLLRSRPDERDRLRAIFEKQAEAKTTAFRRLWKRSFDAPGAEEWWTGYLSRAAHAPRK